MNFKTLFDKCVDFIDVHIKIIIIASLSILGLIVLGIVFILSSEELNVEKESDELIQSIQQRKYSNVIEYYEQYEKKSSEIKMRRFNKSITKRINKLLIESGDKYINNELTKEQYVGMINTINGLDDIEIDINRIIEQTKRIVQMYKDEDIKYDITISYINTVSTLNKIITELDVYKNEIQELEESRNIYRESTQMQNKNMYYEAIDGYEKILKIDKNYYEKGQKQKSECIEQMYDYYIIKIEELNENGNYEDAIKYIEYLKKYYQDDESILTLEKEYKKKLSLYTLSNEDIITLICKKSGKKKENISITSFYEMIEKEKYYYVEVFEYDILIDEVLINAKNKQIYSYKDSNKNYKTNYSDGHFRYTKEGVVQFSTSKDKANFILANALNENNDKYKEISQISKERASKYIKEKENFEQIIGNDEDLYYYQLVNRGIFKQKQVYIINIYTGEIYSVN